MMKAFEIFALLALPGLWGPFALFFILCGLWLVVRSLRALRRPRLRVAAYSDQFLESMKRSPDAETKQPPHG